MRPHRDNQNAPWCIVISLTGRLTHQGMRSIVKIPAHLVGVYFPYCLINPTSFLKATCTLSMIAVAKYLCLCESMILAHYLMFPLSSMLIKYFQEIKKRAKFYFALLPSPKPTVTLSLWTSSGGVRHSTLDDQGAASRVRSSPGISQCRRH